MLEIEVGHAQLRPKARLLSLRDSRSELAARDCSVCDDECDDARHHRCARSRARTVARAILTMALRHRALALGRGRLATLPRRRASSTTTALDILHKQQEIPHKQQIQQQIPHKQQIHGKGCFKE